MVPVVQAMWYLVRWIQFILKSGPTSNFLMFRLEDVKLSISFQNLPAAKELNITGTKDNFQNLPVPRELNKELNITKDNFPRELKEINISEARDIALPSPQQVYYSA